MGGFIDAYIRPPLSSQVDQWEQLLSKQKRRIDTYLLPIFETLIKEDLKNCIYLPGVGIRIDDLGGLVGDGNAIGEIIGECTRRAEDAAGRAKSRQLCHLAGKGSADPEVAQDFFEILNSMSDQIQELLELWRKLRKPVESSTLVEVSRREEGYTIEMPAVIDHFGAILNHPDDAPIFKTEVRDISVQYIPRRIRLSLMLDLSGSMDMFLPEVKRTFVAIAASAVAYNQECRLQDISQRIELEIFGYADELVPLLPPQELRDLQNVMTAYSNVGLYGGTSSHVGFEDYLARLEAGKGAGEERVEFFIEVTDGDTTDVERSARALAQIRKSSVHTRGIKFSGAMQLDAPPPAPGGSGPESAERKAEEDRRYREEAQQRAVQDHFGRLWGADEGLRVADARLFPRALRDSIRALLDQYQELQ